ncbi:MAG: hypothetical protein AAB655_01290, partial [Patescibacteria group bacterium]
MRFSKLIVFVKKIGNKTISFSPLSAEVSTTAELCHPTVDLMRTQWNRVLKELYDWHTLIHSETLKFY